MAVQQINRLNWFHAQRYGCDFRAAGSFTEAASNLLLAITSSRRKQGTNSAGLSYCERHRISLCAVHGRNSIRLWSYRYLLGKSANRKKLHRAMLSVVRNANPM